MRLATKGLESNVQLAASRKLILHPLVANTVLRRQCFASKRNYLTTQ